MPQYRKRPVVVEAEQFFYDQDRRTGELVPRGPVPDGVKYGRTVTAPKCWHVSTLEGEMVVSSGDWIITGIKGEKYPCKPDIFAATYEAVEP